MHTGWLLGIIIAYFSLLLGIAFYTSRNSNNESFFIGNRSSKWWLVAFGMIGTSLSGVTFVSVPGTVQANGLGYFQVVIGYFLGYFVVAFVLLPLYYRLQLTSIYSYLGSRFGMHAYKTGAVFFILSRTLGATARLYLVINVLQIFILDALGVPFALTTLIILVMILLYTFKGGVKTIVWTDTLQTTFMLLGLVVCILVVMSLQNYSLGNTIHAMDGLGYTKMFNTDPASPGYFLKQIIGGAAITVAMTGLDQEMMQKNISVRTLKDSQKNMIVFSVILIVVNALFLLLGGLLYLYAGSNGLSVKGDDLFPTIALQHLSPAVSLIFIIGLISALFPSADGAITALTSSFCIDILGFRRVIAGQENTASQKNLEEKQAKTRLRVHFSFSLVFLLCILVFKWIDNKSIIDVILKVAGFTYGPLLGLFAFGMLTRRNVPGLKIILICIASPLLMLALDALNNTVWYARLFTQDAAELDALKAFSANIFGNYKIGIELLVLNAALVYLGLLAFSSNKTAPQPVVAIPE